jgi:hypothetical protein
VVLLQLVDQVDLGSAELVELRTKGRPPGGGTVDIGLRLPVVEVDGAVRPQDPFAEERGDGGRHVILTDGDALRVLCVPGLRPVVLGVGDAAPGRQGSAGIGEVMVRAQ